ncbi:MAG: CRISPR-associated endoribonuclease Cas2 [Gemmatales bacterium]|nr:MAG: CRISPR-associated endoribonuclease Cas2 [Gemmatales bacterium]
MQGARWWIVIYDVRNDKRLRQTAKHMEGYGERLQYSVFRCWLTPREMERLRWELTAMLEPEDDVMLIPLCTRCHAGIRVTHALTKRPDWPDTPERFQIV